MARFASRHIATIASLGAIAVVVVLATATSTGRNVVDAIVNGDTRELRHQLLGLGVGGVFVLLTVCLSHAIIPFPTEIVSAAAGFVYGFWLAVPILLICWLASALLAYWLAERFGRPLARRLVGTRRLQRAEELMDRLPKVYGPEQEPQLSAGCRHILERAFVEAETLTDEYVSTEHLFLALLDGATDVAHMLRELSELGKVLVNLVDLRLER